MRDMGGMWVHFSFGTFEALSWARPHASDMQQGLRMSCLWLFFGSMGGRDAGTGSDFRG
jgi:hypothetical protein